MLEGRAEAELTERMSTTSHVSHSDQPRDRGAFSDGLNKLRAGVLGANDGIVSVAAVVVGVAGATSALAPIVTAGAAAVVGGAISMALGEYVSVASARDSQTALIAKEKQELAELHIDEHEVLKPWQAAVASGLAFLAGAVLPMLAILLPPPDLRIPITFVATLIALGVTGALGAVLGKSPWLRPTLRVLVGGALALAVTFGIGALLGTAIA